MYHGPYFYPKSKTKSCLEISLPLKLNRKWKSLTPSGIPIGLGLGLGLLIQNSGCHCNVITFRPLLIS